MSDKPVVTLRVPFDGPKLDVSVAVKRLAEKVDAQVFEDVMAKHWPGGPWYVRRIVLAEKVVHTESEPKPDDETRVLSK